MFRYGNGFLALKNMQVTTWSEYKKMSVRVRGWFHFYEINLRFMKHFFRIPWIFTLELSVLNLPNVLSD